jgi:Family of unknown function (DUF5677)
MTLSLPETRAYPPLLNRAEAEQFVSEHLKELISALESVVNYGTHLIPRCWLSSPRTVRDMVQLAVLLKQIITMEDGATELLKQGCVEPAYLQLRAAFEASVYLDWILKAKTPARARAYFVWNLRRLLKWAQRAQRGTRERRHYRADLQRINVWTSFDTREGQRFARTEATRIEVDLAARRNRAWNRRFDKLRGNSRFDRDWYQVFFAKRRSLYHLAKITGRRAEYRLIYEVGSESMHASRSDVHVRVQKGGILRLRSLRELPDFPFVAQMLLGIAVHSYMAILRAYRHDELQAFRRQYNEEWRRAFLSSIQIQYRYEEVRIR